MPTETDVIEQVDLYGKWLEAELATELTNPPATSRNPTSKSLDSAEVEQSHRELWPRVLIGVAFVAAIVGFVWLAQPDSVTETIQPAATDPTNTSSAATGTSDPTGGVAGRPIATRAEAADTPTPLYLLPASLDGFRTDETDREELPSGDTGSAILVGRIEADGYTDLSFISLVEEPTFGTTGNPTEVGDHSVLVADYGIEDTNPSIAVETGTGRWIEIFPARPELRQLLLDNTTVIDGKLEFTVTDNIEELDRIPQLEAVRTRFLNLQSEEGEPHGVAILVRTTPEADGFPASRVGSGPFEEVTVRGHTGLLAQFLVPEGPDLISLTWLEAPHQIVGIFVSGDIDPIAFAEALRIVDEDTWHAELDEAQP